MRAAFSCVLGVTLSGCDFVFGVGRGAKITELPKLDCVSQAIRATPGIASVEERKAPTDRDYPPIDVYDFRYDGIEGSSIEGVLQFMASRGSVEFEDSNLRLNAKPPQRQIDATRPVMRQIESNLINQCGVTLASPVREECSGVKCPALAGASPTG